jgi:hypothetical protein
VDTQRSTLNFLFTRLTYTRHAFSKGTVDMLMEEFEDLCSVKINISTFFFSMAWKLYPKLKRKIPSPEYSGLF